VPAVPRLLGLLKKPLELEIPLEHVVSGHALDLKGAIARAKVSGVPDLDAHVRFCRTAEESGIESVLTAFGYHRPAPLLLATAVGMRTERIKFMVAVRSGVCSPTLFVQQVNTVSVMLGGRICLNMVAGHTPEEQAYYGDFLSHNERYERADEFLSICRALWSQQGEVSFHGRFYRVEKARLNTPFLSQERVAPELFIGGNSEQAEALTLKHGECLWRFPHAPEHLRPRVAALTAQGKEVGLIVSVIARPTRGEALRAASDLLSQVGQQSQRTHQEFYRKSDSVAFRSTLALAAQEGTEWLTPYLWTGAVPYLGAPSIALVGSAREVANAMLEYKEIGISQFLMLGWPDIEEMAYFGGEVLPLIRQEERRSERAPPSRN